MFSRARPFSVQQKGRPWRHVRVRTHRQKSDLAFPPQHVWNPSATCSDEKGGGQSSIPTAPSRWRVPEFDPSRTEETGTGVEGAELSEIQVFKMMRDIVQSATASRKDINDLRTTNQALSKEVEDLHKTVTGLEKLLGSRK